MELASSWVSLKEHNSMANSPLPCSCQIAYTNVSLALSELQAATMKSGAITHTHTKAWKSCLLWYWTLLITPVFLHQFAPNFDRTTESFIPIKNVFMVWKVRSVVTFTIKCKFVQKVCWDVLCDIFITKLGKMLSVYSHCSSYREVRGHSEKWYWLE